MLDTPTVTARASFRRRLPPQSGQGPQPCTPPDPAHGVALGLPVAALQVVDHALEGLHQGALAVLPVVGQLELLPLVP